MRRLAKLFLSLTVLLVFAAIAAADTPLTIREGISGIPWGAELTSVQGTAKTYEKENIVYLKKPGEQYLLKTVNLGSVLYGFYEHRFFAAYMRVGSRDDAEKIIGLLNTDIGPVRRQLRVSETVYIWDYHDVKIKLKELKDKNLFKLSFYYTPISNQLNESRMDQNFEFTMDLVPAR